MTIVANFSHINTYRDVTFLQSIKLYSGINAALYLDSSHSNNEKEIQEWQKTAHCIYDSILNEKFSFYTFIVDLVTFQYLKKVILRVMLPNLIKKIDAQAVKTSSLADKTITKLSSLSSSSKTPVVPIKEVKVPSNKALPALDTTVDKIKSLPTGQLPVVSIKEPPVSLGKVPVVEGSSKSLEVALRVKEYFEKNKRLLFDKENARRKEEFFKEWTSNPQKRIYCRTQEEADKIFVEVEKEVSEYLDQKIQSFKKGENVQLPWFYHATKQEKLFSIIHFKQIHVKYPYGKTLANGFFSELGAYFSTKDESSPRFGEVTIALGAEDLSKQEADYLEVGTQKHKNAPSALWVRVKKDVSLTSKTVAHIVVENNEDKKRLFDKVNAPERLVGSGGMNVNKKTVKEMIDQCPILTRWASDIICQSFHDTHIYQLSKTWERTQENLPGPGFANLPYLQEYKPA
jgi:hypothetical protein